MSFFSPSSKSFGNIVYMFCITWLTRCSERNGQSFIKQLRRYYDSVRYVAEML